MTDRLVKIRFIGEGITTVTGQVTALGKSVGASADKMTGASKESAKFRRGLTDIGNTAGKVGLVAAAGLGAIVVATANFEQAMSRVEAATHASATSMRDLRQAAIIAGRDTVFSATEAADAITAMSKAGVSAKDILGGGLSGALSLASAGELDVATAADIAATAMNQFGLEGRDIPHIADLLAAAAGKAQGEVTDMAASLKYVGPVAHQMGISIEETTGTIAELAAQGILGEQAGTSLRGMLTSLTSPSQLASTTMKKLGINLYDATGQFVGLRGIAGQLGETMGTLTNAERDQALGRIFGNEQITAARILYAGGAEAVDKWTASVNAQGYAAETAAIKLDNLKGDVEQLKGSLETALIGAGSGSQGPLRQLVQGLTDAVNAFNKLPGPAKNVASSLLAIAAVTGGALWFGSKVIGSIARTRVALAELGVQAKTTRSTLASVGKGLAVFAAIEGVNALSNSLIDSEASVRRWQETLLARSGPDVKAQLAAVTAEIKKQQEIADSAFGPQFSILGKDVAPLAFSSDWKNANIRLDALRETEADLKHQMELGAIATGKQTAAVRVGGTTAGLTADQIQEMNKALEESRKLARETADEFFGVGKKVDKAKVSLDKWLKDLQKQTAALRDFTQNIKTATKRGLDDGLIKSLEAAGPAGALRMKQLADGTKEQIHEANKAWRDGERAVEHYVNVVGGVPQTVVTELEVRKAQAEAAVKRITDMLKKIPRAIRTDYYVNQINSVNKPKVLPGQAGQADGGTVPGPRYPYGDKVDRKLAPGEEVISNRRGQADKWRPLLKAINAGMADGGTVGRSMPAGAMSSSLGGGLSDGDVDRIAGALLAARPIYGPVHLSGDRSFERHQRERLASLDGMKR